MQFHTMICHEVFQLFVLVEILLLEAIYVDVWVDDMNVLEYTANLILCLFFK